MKLIEKVLALVGFQTGVVRSAESFLSLFFKLLVIVVGFSLVLLIIKFFYQWLVL